MYIMIIQSIIASGWYLGNITVLGSVTEKTSQYLQSSNEKDAFLVKYNTEGELQWSRTLGGTSDQIITKIITNDSFMYIFFIKVMLQAHIQMK